MTAQAGSRSAFGMEYVSYLSKTLAHRHTRADTARVESSANVCDVLQTSAASSSDRGEGVPLSCLCHERPTGLHALASRHPPTSEAAGLPPPCPQLRSLPHTVGRDGRDGGRVAVAARAPCYARQRPAKAAPSPTVRRDTHTQFPRLRGGAGALPSALVNATNLLCCC